MRRLSVICAALVAGIAAAAPHAGAEGLQRRPIAPQRVPSTLHRDWPIRRPPREVVVRRPEVRIRITPRVYLPPVFFGAVIFDRDRHDRDYRDDRRYRGRGYGEDRGYDGYRPYSRSRLTWSDSETLYREDGWSEVTLECNARGARLWFEVRDGRARIDWAEIVFENGEVQVVDFAERSIGPGVYPLLDFRDGRRVDHVRMVAEAASREVQLVLRMEL